MLKNLKQKVLSIRENLSKRSNLKKSDIKKQIINKRVNILRRIKIRQRLIISFLIISILPLMVLGITSFTSARTLVSDIIKQYTEQAVLQFGNNVTTELNKVTETANSFLFQQLFRTGSPITIKWRFMTGE